MSTFVPAHVSEFPDATRVTDCVPATALMVANKVTHNRFPASVDERELLQSKMPDPTPDAKPGTEDEGATNEQAAAGLRTLLGLSVPVIADRTALLAALGDPTKGVGVIGSYQTLPAFIRNHGRQSTFDGLHDMYFGGLGGGEVIVGDPLGSMMGPVASIEDVTPYLRSTAYGALVGTEARRLVGYRLVMRGGPFTAWHVARFTHLLYGPVTNSYGPGSWAPVAHGSPGFWMWTAGAARGLYAVYGRSQAFDIQAVWSDGARTPVAAWT